MLVEIICINDKVNKKIKYSKGKIKIKTYHTKNPANAKQTQHWKLQLRIDARTNILKALRDRLT